MNPKKEKKKESPEGKGQEKSIHREASVSDTDKKGGGGITPFARMFWKKATPRPNRVTYQKKKKNDGEGETRGSSTPTRGGKRVKRFC